MTEQEKMGGSQGVVMYGDTQIAFTSWGHGPAVVLLCGHDSTSELIVALAVRFRVIVPSVPARVSEQELANLVSVLVDGLGLARPAIVLVGQFSAFALAACNESERLGPIAAFHSVPHSDQIAALVERLSLQH